MKSRDNKMVPRPPIQQSNNPFNPSNSNTENNNNNNQTGNFQLPQQTRRGSTHNYAANIHQKNTNSFEHSPHKNINLYQQTNPPSHSNVIPVLRRSSESTHSNSMNTPNDENAQITQRRHSSFDSPTGNNQSEVYSVPPNTSQNSVNVLDVLSQSNPNRLQYNPIVQQQRSNYSVYQNTQSTNQPIDTSQQQHVQNKYSPSGMRESSTSSFVPHVSQRNVLPSISQFIKKESKEHGVTSVEKKFSPITPLAIQSIKLNERRNSNEGQQSSSPRQYPSHQQSPLVLQGKNPEWYEKKETHSPPSRRTSSVGSRFAPQGNQYSMLSRRVSYSNDSPNYSPDLYRRMSTDKTNRGIKKNKSHLIYNLSPRYPNPQRRDSYMSVDSQAGSVSNLPNTQYSGSPVYPTTQERYQQRQTQPIYRNLENYTLKSTRAPIVSTSTDISTNVRDAGKSTKEQKLVNLTGESENVNMFDTNETEFFVFEYDLDKPDEELFRKLDDKETRKLERKYRNLYGEFDKTQLSINTKKFYWHYWSDSVNPRCTRWDKVPDRIKNRKKYKERMKKEKQKKVDNNDDDDDLNQKENEDMEVEKGEEENEDCVKK